MTPEQIDLVNATFAQVDRERLGERFYAILFERYPSVRPLFPTDTAQQQTKLVEELAAIVDVVNDLPSLEARAHPLGAGHVAYGAQAEHYAPVGECLIAALGEVADDFDDDAVQAWVRAYWLVAEAMLDGADAAEFAASD